MKKYFHKHIILAFLCFMLTACGYQFQNFKMPAVESVIGDGSATLSINSIEQSTMYTWIPYFIRTTVRDEVNLRKLAVWQDTGTADYILNIRLPSFRIEAFDNNAKNEPLISSATVTVEFTIYETKTGQVVWQSGAVQYSDRYENPREEIAIRDVLTQALRRTLDNLQMNF